MAKRKDLQPWLDYFDMLRTYKRKGFLEIPEQRAQSGTRSDSDESQQCSTENQAQLDRHEAYITRAALFTLTEYDDVESLTERSADAMTRRTRSVTDAVNRIRIYAAYVRQWKNVKDGKLSEAYADVDSPFALHVVKEDEPHDLLYTLFFTRKRTWRSLWLTKCDHIEIISYDTTSKSTDNEP